MGDVKIKWKLNNTFIENIQRILESCEWFIVHCKSVPFKDFKTFFIDSLMFVDL